MTDSGGRGGGGGVRAAVGDYLRSPANLFTALRLLSIPVLWALALLGETRALGIGLGLAFATDVIDGYLARRLGPTEIGSRTDSLADHLLTLSTVAWLLMLRPEFIRDHLPYLAAWGALALFTLGVAWTRFRRFVDLHLYSAKAAVFLANSWAVLFLATGDYWRPHWWAAFGAACFAALESLAMMSMRRRADEHQGSLVLLLLRRRRRAREPR